MTCNQMSPRLWEIRTRYNGRNGFDVAAFRWQRQAYRFAIDWFTDDPALEQISIQDEAGRAEPLTLKR